MPLREGAANVQDGEVHARESRGEGAREGRGEGAPDLPVPSFRAIFDTELATVWHALRRLGVHPRDLEDQVHETFVIAHRKLGTFDSTRSVRPWLLGIAYRCAADYRKLARHGRELFAQVGEPVDSAIAADEQVACNERRRLLHRALESLAPAQREVVVLHDLEELVMPDIAALLEVPLATAYSRLRLGRVELSKALERLRRREEKP
jgi:RNA polymerase sigma-70 factor (ECF subfamily)